MLDITKPTTFHSQNDEDRFSFLYKFATEEELIIAIEGGTEDPYYLHVEKIAIEHGGQHFFFEGIITATVEKITCKGLFNCLDRKGWLQKIESSEWSC